MERRITKVAIFTFNLSFYLSIYCFYLFAGDACDKSKVSKFKKK